MRFCNDHGSVITVNDLGQKVGPFEEFDWPGYDKAVHGPVAGCTPLESETAQVSDLGSPGRGEPAGKVKGGRGSPIRGEPGRNPRPPS